MGLDTGTVRILDSQGIESPEIIHIEGSSDKVRVYLGIQEGTVPDFSLSPAEARSMARALELAADYAEPIAGW